MVGGATAVGACPARPAAVPVPPPTPCSSAAPTALLSVDLDDGDVDRRSPRRQSAGGRSRRCASVPARSARGPVASVPSRPPAAAAEPRVSDLGGDATDLVFRVNRGEIVLNDAHTGAVWDVDSGPADPIDNWDVVHSSRPTRPTRTSDNENQDDGDRRPPQAKPDVLRRACRSHHRAAPARQRHRAGRAAAEHRRRRQPHRCRRRVDHQPRRADGADRSCPRAPGPTRFDYFDRRRSQRCLRHRHRGRHRCAPTRRRPRSCARATRSRTCTVPPAAPSTPGARPTGATRRRRPAARSTPRPRPWAARRPARSPARRPTAGSGSLHRARPTAAAGHRRLRRHRRHRSEPVRTSRSASRCRRSRTARPSPASPSPTSYAVRSASRSRSGPLANDLPGSDPVTPTAVSQLAGKVAQVGGAKVVTDLDGDRSPSPPTAAHLLPRLRRCATATPASTRARSGST